MWTWAAVHRELVARPARTVLRFPLWALPDPRLHGASDSVGLPAGQGADLRFPPDPACRGLHVHAFADRWEAHLDRVHPACDLLEHLRQDAPVALYVAGTSIGAALGGIVGKSGGHALAGAGVGLLVAAIVHSAGR
jgi:hypothetical protein